MKHEHMSPMHRFERLSRMRGCRIDKHQIDPRGWHVVNAERRTIGEVKDVIVDTERMAGAYLDVELDRKLFDLHDDPHLLVPMARADRDGDHKRLLIDGLTRDRVATMCVARAEHAREFWDRWWDVGRATGTADWAPSIARGAESEQLRQALEDVRPGETVRIPVVNEEIVVERRPIGTPDK
jgi:hypothetical protein